MSFVDVVLAVAKLAQERNDEDKAHKKRLGLEHGVELGTKEADEYMHAPRPAKAALRAHLEGLDEAVVLKLEAVMYGGRDKNPNFRGLAQQLSHNKSDAVRTMMEKSPLGDYLAEGLVLAQRSYVDLEGAL